MKLVAFFSASLIITALLITGCASSGSKKGGVSSKDKEAWQAILEVSPPTWDETGDSDMDQLIGSTFERSVVGLEKDMKEIRSILTTNRDYISFTNSVAARAEADGISNGEASGIVISNLRAMSIAGDQNATARLNNVQEALTRIKGNVDSLEKNSADSLVFILKQINAFQNLKSKVDNAGTFEKIKLGAAFAKGLGQLNEFNSYSKTCKEYTKYMKNQINHPAWNS